MPGSITLVQMSQSGGKKACFKTVRTLSGLRNAGYFIKDISKFRTNIIYYSIHRTPQNGKMGLTLMEEMMSSLVEKQLPHMTSAGSFVKRYLQTIRM